MWSGSTWMKSGSNGLRTLPRASKTSQVAASRRPSGVDEASLEQVRRFYETVVDRTVAVSSAKEEIRAADLVVVLTDHDKFAFDLVAEYASHTLDCRRVPELEAAERL